MRACIERLGPNRVDGWAYHDGVPDERLSMALIFDGQVVAEALAENYREDLKLNGLGDGCYGYVFSDIPIANLQSAYLSGRIEVRAAGKGAPPVFAHSADNLRTQIESFFRCQMLETKSFPELLSSISSSESADLESAGKLLDLLNASRAHFPEWRLSAEFHRRAAALAVTAARPHTQRFYEQQLSHLVEPTTSVDSWADAVKFRRLPRDYGSLKEWAESDHELAIHLVEPKFYSGENRISFLEEVRILDPDPVKSSHIKVLAFKEDAFGEPSWWAVRNGVRCPVARNLYYLDFETLRLVLDDGGFVFIDMSNEGPTAEDDWIVVLNRAILELQINPKQVVLINQNLRFGMGKSTKTKFLGHVTIAHFFICKTLSFLAEQIPTEAHAAKHCASILASRDQISDKLLKHYICLNFTPKWPRWATVLHLSLHGLLEKGHVSFPGQTNYKLQDSIDLEKFLPQLVERRDLLQHVPHFLEKCPLRLDMRGNPTTSPDFNHPTEFTTGSLFHIVTESEMSDGEYQFRITEKIMKPIVGLQPFIVAGNPGSLALMKAMGFRTFGSLFDESYDSIKDPAVRLDAVFREIDRLSSVPVQRLREAVRQINETLIHNFLHLLMMGPLLFNGAIRNRLHKLVNAQISNQQIGLQVSDR